MAKTIWKKPDKYADLKKFPVLVETSSFELYLLNNFLHKRNFNSGELLYNNHPLEVIYFIFSGEVEVTGITYPKGRYVVRELQILGLIDMFKEETRSSSATALTEVTAYAVSRYDLSDLFRQNPNLGVKMLTAFCQTLSNYIFNISSPGGKEL